jgi:hypothetical protein
MTGTTFYRFADSEPYTGRHIIDEGKVYGFEPCWKCDGHGIIPYFAHVSDGRCFKCQGDKYLRFRLYNEKQNAIQLRRFAKQMEADVSRALVNSEIQSLYSIKRLVRNGLRQIERLRANAASGYTGEIGDRIERDVTLVFVIGFDSFYGTTWTNIMRDSDNNVIAYKGSRRLGDKGDTFKIKGTVKEHTLYKGVKQTVINRPKVAA